MTSSGEVSGRTCQLVGSEKLPRDVSADMVCAAIERALAANASVASVSVRVTIKRPSLLVASLVVDGRKLPDQNFAVMDRDLNPASVERFARSIAVSVANASKH